jgi:hypothetical protein
LLFRLHALTASRNNRSFRGTCFGFLIDLIFGVPRYVFGIRKINRTLSERLNVALSLSSKTDRVGGFHVCRT